MCCAAQTYERSGKQEETIRELSHTLDLNPGFKPAEMLLYHLKQRQTSGIDGYFLWTGTIIVILSTGVFVLLFYLLFSQMPDEEGTPLQAPSLPHKAIPSLQTANNDSTAKPKPLPIDKVPGKGSVRRRKTLFSWLSRWALTLFLVFFSFSYWFRGASSLLYRFFEFIRLILVTVYPSLSAGSLSLPVTQVSALVCILLGQGG